MGTEAQFYSFYVIVAMAIVGAFVLRRWRVAVFPLLMIPVIALFAVATTFAQWRYRATAEPALAMLAAAAVLGGIRWYENRRTGSSPESVDGGAVDAPRQSNLTAE